MMHANALTLPEIWVYLSGTPLLWLIITLVAYQFGVWLYGKSRHNPLLTPISTAVALIIAILVASGTPYKTYFDGAQFVHFLLGPMTVALGMPLYEQRHNLRRLWLPVIGALMAGTVTAIASTIVIAGLLGASPLTMLSLVPKSVTAPIAMGISESIGGLPSFTAAIVILTGIIGVMLIGIVFRFMPIKSDAATGFACGLAAHGIGTARAFAISSKAGAFSGLAMGLTGISTALVAPWLAPWLIRLFVQ